MVNEALKAYRNPQWEKRDWAFFGGLLEFPLEQHPQKNALALLMAGSALQLDDAALSERLMAKAQGLVEAPLLYAFSFTVLQIQLARAEFLAGYPQKALLKFQAAWQEFGVLTAPLLYDFLFEQAEAQLAAGDARAAIQTLQDLAAIMQAHTPEAVYHRMSEGYAVNKAGFGCTTEENRTWGDFHKHDLLDLFHQHLKPDFYFEIGVDQGLSLARAKGRALGVDARPVLDLRVELPDTAEVLGMSSDLFFREKAADYFGQQAPDLAFIDGMHLFEFALRDFMHLEQFSAPYALIGIDDVFPCHPIQAERRRVSNSWTGDVWKLIPILQTYRPDLTLLMLPCSTTGLLLIAGLDKTNLVLHERYDEIMAAYQCDLPVPESILQRTGTVPSDHPVVSLLLSSLYRAKVDAADTAQVREILQPFQSMMALAMSTPNISEYAKALHKMEAQQASTRSMATLYWRTPVLGYREANSVKRHYPLDGALQSLTLRLPEVEGLNGLRLDIAGREGCFFVNRAVLHAADGSELWAFEVSRIKDVAQLEITTLPNNRVCWISTGTDPRFELDLPVEVLPLLSGATLIIEFTALVV